MHRVPTVLVRGHQTIVSCGCFAQIGPITTVPAPWYLAPLVELFLHTLPIPPFLVSGIYKKLLAFFRDAGAELLDIAEKKIGLEREEALHNLVFLTTFNAWGGINLLLPLIVKRLGATSADFQKELAAEVRKAVNDNGGKLSPKALEAMPLVVSTLYEVLRIDPPVPYQYAKAKEDLVIESHDAAFKIKKGETLAGYMPVCCRDPKVFDQAETFLPKRFLGDEGKALLKYVLWSNGPQTEETTTENKHCAGKNFVLLVGQLFLASFYLQYDSLEVDSTQTSLTALKPNAAAV
jgi:hydroperoxide dehydratase